MDNNDNKKDVWKTYGIWAFWVGIAFFSVYPTCNWLTSQREITYPLYLELELTIPFIPGFFWAYMSMYILFMFPPFFLNVQQLKRLGKQLVFSTILSGILFLLVPTKLGFERIAPDNPFYQNLFNQLFNVDHPHNLVPSLHVIFSAIIVFALLEGTKKNHTKILFILWLTVLCLSTLLVHQHHLLDVISGLLIAVIFYKFYKNRG